MRAGVGTELEVAQYMHRSFHWHTAAVFLEDLPARLWAAGRLAVVVCAEDNLIEAARTHAYLTGRGWSFGGGDPEAAAAAGAAAGPDIPRCFGPATGKEPACVLDSQGNQLLWVPGAGHGGWGLQPAIKTRLLATIAVRTKALPFCCASTVFLSKKAPFHVVPLSQAWVGGSKPPEVVTPAEQRQRAEAARQAATPSWMAGIDGLDRTLGAARAPQHV
eukprot:SAG22_NODE_4272_length_1322_cov_1.037612_1_plen_218_part_00